MLRLVLLFAVIALFVRYVDFHSLLTSVARINARTIALCIGLEWVFYAIESFRIRTLAGRVYPYRAVWRSRLLATAVTNVLPGMGAGEVIRVFILDRARPGHKVFIALTFLANRLYGVLSSATLLLAALALGLGAVASPLRGQAPLFAAGAVMLVALPLGFRIPFLRGLVYSVLRRLHGGPRRLVRTLYRAMTRFSHPREWAIAVATSMITNLVVVCEFWLMGLATGLHMGLPLWIIVLVSVSAFAGFLPVRFRIGRLAGREHGAGPAELSAGPSSRFWRCRSPCTWCGSRARCRACSISDDARPVLARPGCRRPLLVPPPPLLILSCAGRMASAITFLVMNGKQSDQLQYYQRLAQEYDQKFRRENPNHLYKISQIARAFLEYLPPRAEGYDFLEVGGGTGIHAFHFLSGLKDRVRSFVLSDLSPAMLEQAKGRLSAHANVDYLVSPGESLATERKFDGIYVSGAMHHFASPAKSISAKCAHI